jgi:hypothetical protein
MHFRCFKDYNVNDLPLDKLQGIMNQININKIVSQEVKQETINTT